MKNSQDQISTNFQTLKTLPQPTGPHRVGMAKYDLEDIYRKDFTFPSGRLIPIQVYFPLEKGTHTSGSKKIEERALIGPWKPLHTLVYSKDTKLTSMVGEQLPIIFINHASYVPMTDYSFVAEDLASHGNVIISIQHELVSDEETPPFWKDSSCSRNAKVIDNILYTFEWLKANQHDLFQNKINLKRIGLIGHSLGANSLLLWINQTLNTFKQDSRRVLFSREDQTDIKECFILMEPSRFSFALNDRYPLFFLFAEEREAYQKKTGCYDQIIQSGHQLNYYKGSTHISFMDHGYIFPQTLFKPDEFYFNGTVEERIKFFDQIRADIRSFIKTSFIQGNSKDL